MELEIPNWLTKEYIQSALNDSDDKEYGKDVVVDNIQVDKPIAKGNNYVCDIFRVEVDYRTKDVSKKTSLIIKAPIQGGIYEFIAKCGIVEKEVRIYQEVLPKINKYLNLNSDNQLSPKSFKSTENGVIILEDLKFKNYEMADRKKQLDYDHCVMALKTLAKFHAASVKMHEDDPHCFDQVGKEVFFCEELKEMNGEFAKLNFRMFAEEIKGWPGYEKYAELLTGYSENSFDILSEIIKPKDNEFNVLNHGDFWVTNMLFKYDDNRKPIDVKLIDLQVSRYSSPAIDLIYFFTGSVQEEVRDTKMEDLLNVYIQELNLHLEKLGSKEKIDEGYLKKKMDESDFFAVQVSLSLLPIIVADVKESEMMDMKELKPEDFQGGGTNPFLHYYKNEKYQTVIKKRLIEFEKKGWF